MTTILAVLGAVIVAPALFVLALLTHRAAVGAAPTVTEEMIEEEERGVG